MRTLLPLVFTLAAAACSKPAPPTLAPEKVSLTRVDMTGIAMDVSIAATNPNSVDLAASGVSSHVVVDKTHDVGSVTVPSTVTLPAGKTTTLDVPVTLTWSDIGVLGPLALTNAGVQYVVNGSLEMGGNLLHVTVPFRIEGTITREQIASAMLNSIPKPR